MEKEFAGLVTREKLGGTIRGITENVDYHPNLRARNFSKKSTKTVMWVTSLEKDIGFSNPHMFEIMCGLESVLSDKGYLLMIKSTNAKDAVEYIKEMYHAQLADGFVIHASVISPELDEMIYREKIPHLIVGLPNFENHFCWIDVDNRLAGEQAAKYLLESGYQSLAFIGGTDDDKITVHRLNALRDKAICVPEEMGVITFDEYPYRILYHVSDAD